ncbi:unnamed protein product [Lymnaea stagnalis]|uniref:SET domain-containing protein 9 n=1 Tax=Lymnaea stagnalis TaxID=6523 RepID=A0AAV2H0A9_LYMST
MKNRNIKSVTDHDMDSIPEEKLIDDLYKFLSKLHKQLSDLQLVKQERLKIKSLEIMRDVSGFTVERVQSVLPTGGLGVKVTSGFVPVGSITSLYPGLIYESHEPIFFQSIGNSFIFRCADGLLIDGNDRGLSKSLYKSCRGRDSCWPMPACDDSWLKPELICPLNIGQYVNNHNKQYPANVAYQELDIPDSFPAHLRQYLPNNFYSPSLNVSEGMQRYKLLRVVALVSVKEIKSGEELFSSYFTLVR